MKPEREELECRPLSAEYDAQLAMLVRGSLKAHGLDLPGTVYFDESLDHLSVFYDCPKRAYFVLLKDGEVAGGIGLAEFEGFENCCELQKLYLRDDVKGCGLGYELIRMIEDQARAMGYARVYLETHTNLQAALHIYEKSGYRLIERPAGVVHGTMNRFYMKEMNPSSGKNPV